MFPTFTEDTVFFEAQVPLSFEKIEQMISQWAKHSHVTVHVLGKSLGGRNIYRLETGQDRRWPSGPLRVCTDNPRYFADPSGRPVYLTGAHTWQSLQDGILQGYTTVTQPFHYTGYLDLLQANRHNFIRLWRWDRLAATPIRWI